MKKILFAIVIATAFASAQTVPLIYMTGGGSLNPSATNAALEAAISFSRDSISNCIEALSWDTLAFLHDGSSSSNRFVSPSNSDYHVLPSDRFAFFAPSPIKGHASFQIFTSPSDLISIRIIGSPTVQFASWELELSCDIKSTPINFLLLVTLAPFEGAQTKQAKTMVFSLQRTF